MSRHVVTSEPSPLMTESGKNPVRYGPGTGSQPPRLKPQGIEGTAKFFAGVVGIARHGRLKPFWEKSRTGWSPVARTTVE